MADGSLETVHCDSAGRSPAPRGTAAGGRSAAGRRSRVSLTAAYVVYVPLAVVLVILSRHHHSVDGVAYLRIARYYVEGSLDLALNGYWSPMLSWLLAACHVLGIDLRLAAKVINALAGAVFIFGVDRLALRTGLRDPVRAVMPVGAGLLALSWLPRAIGPDMMFAALLTLYFGHSLMMSRSLGVADAVGAGMCAGIGYLTKGYALPFFVLHHALASTILGRRETGRWLGGRQVRCWAAGMVAFAVFAGPWIAVLSVRYGRPTFSVTGKYVHSLAAPDGGYEVIYRLAPATAGRITNWENPDEIPHPWPSWSPLGSRAEMLHQLRLVYRNGREMATQFFAVDGLGLLYIALLATPLLACVPGSGQAVVDPSLWRWSVVTFGCYLSGFLFIFASSYRYYLPLHGLLLVLAGQLGTTVVWGLWPSRGRVRKEGIEPTVSGPLPDGRGSDQGCGSVQGFGSDRGCGSGQGRGWQARLATRVRSHAFWERVIAGVLVWSCFLPVVAALRDNASRPGLALERLAMSLAAEGVGGPLATNHWYSAAVIGYYLQAPCAGQPQAGPAEAMLAELRQAGVRTFLRFEGDVQPDCAADLDELYPHLGPASPIMEEGGIKVRVYRLPGVQPTARQE